MIYVLLRTEVRESKHCGASNVSGRMMRVDLVTGSEEKSWHVKRSELASFSPPGRRRSRVPVKLRGFVIFTKC